MGKMKPRDLQAILIVFGLLAVFLTYKFVFTTMNASTEEVKKGNVAMEKQIADLQDKKDNQLKYEAQMKEDERETKDILDKIPQGFDVEGNIEYIIKMIQDVSKKSKKSGKVEIQSVSYEPVGEFYKFTGDGDTQEENLPTISSTKVTMNFQCSYDALKGMTDTISYYGKNKMRIDDVTANFSDETGGFSGTITLSAFTSDNTEIGRKYKEPKFNVKVKEKNIVSEFGKASR